MNWQIFTESRVVESLGWTLIHSFWQIGLVAAILVVLGLIVNRSAANLRYGVSVLALVISLTLPVVTFVQLSSSDAAGHFFVGANERSGYEREPNEGERNIAGPALSTDSRASNDKGTATTWKLFAGLRAFLDRNLSSKMPFAVGMWLLGVALFSFRLCGGLWQLRRYKMHGIEHVDANWKHVFLALCEKLKIDRQIDLLRSNLVETPIAIGFFRPLIIVPTSAFLQISPRELETIIAHELIHIRRYDLLVNMIQSAIEVLFFYHPGIWWISKQIRLEREFATDSAVVDIFEGSHVVYANALANLEEIRHLANKQMPRIATAANGGNLMRRIQRILKIKTEMTRANSAWSAGLAIVLISAVLTVVFSFSSSSLVNAQGKTGNRKVAIGFVSIPPLDRSENPPKDSVATAKILVGTLKAHKVPAVGFINGSSVSDGDKIFPVRAEIVKMWHDEGLEIGVGGFNHLWFYDTSYDDYVANTEKNEVVARKILEGKTPIRYFSYPYLNTGRSSDDHSRFEAWLSQRGLASVKYTIDNNEWMYSYVYDLARNDNDLNLMQETQTAYLAYMSKMFDHYEAYSRDMFGRDIAQTMVLTPSRLVADTADRFFEMIEKRGYAFVTMDDAQSDPAYQTSEDFVGKAGISWFERWRMKEGKPLLDEPKVEPGVQKIWDAKKIVQGNKKKDN